MWSQEWKKEKSNRSRNKSHIFQQQGNWQVEQNYQWKRGALTSWGVQDGDNLRKTGFKTPMTFLTSKHTKRNFWHYVSCDRQSQKEHSSFEWPKQAVLPQHMSPALRKGFTASEGFWEFWILETAWKDMAHILWKICVALFVSWVIVFYQNTAQWRAITESSHSSNSQSWNVTNPL